MTFPPEINEAVTVPVVPPTAHHERKSVARVMHAAALNVEPLRFSLNVPAYSGCAGHAFGVIWQIFPEFDVGVGVGAGVGVGVGLEFGVGGGVEVVAGIVPAAVA